jgi:ABC-type multidrug transport system ATPase subunit
LDYLVGINGGKLSGGQKQRIAISRALLTHPKILILDEATSSLDIQSEKDVQMAINSLQNGVTLIIIAHRLSTIINADKIVLLGKEGNILEMGSHNELLQNKGQYFHTIQSQFKQIDVVENDKKLILKNEESESFDKYNNKLVEDETSNNGKYSNDMIIQNRTKLSKLLCSHKCLLITAIISSICGGAFYPMVMYFNSQAINGLNLTDLEEMQRQVYICTMAIFGLSIGYGLCEFIKM